MFVLPIPSLTGFQFSSASKLQAGVIIHQNWVRKHQTTISEVNVWWNYFTISQVMSWKSSKWQQHLKTVGARVKFQDDCCWQGGRGRVLFLWCKTACFALRSRCFFHLGSGALIVSILSKPRPPSISHSKKNSLLVWLYFLLKVDFNFIPSPINQESKPKAKNPIDIW